MAAFAAGGDGDGVDALAEFDDRYEAVAAGAVPSFCSWIRTRAERGQRSPSGRCEADRDARFGVVPRVIDISCKTLESIDLAPRRFPASEVAGEFVGRSGERFEPLTGRGLGRGVVV